MINPPLFYLLMRIEVYIKDRVVSISCGVGAQKIRWLAEAATLRFDNNGMLSTGEPKSVKLEDGTTVGMNDRICDRLVDNSRVWLIYDEYSTTEKKK